jgi:hypothetical protein
MALTLVALIAGISFTARSFGGMLLAVFFIFISLLPITGLKNVLVLLSSITLSLTVAEFAIGIFNNHPAYTFHNPTHRSPDSDYPKGYWSKSDLGQQPLPGRHTSILLSAEGDVIYDVVYSIGEDGFRITKLTNHTAQIHINFFGCSFTFGEGLNDNETLPHFVHSIDNNASVKNYGMHGYGVHQALRILESTRDTRGNINFLLTAPWHAERSACHQAFNQGSPKYAFADDGRLTLDGTCPPPSDINSLRNRIFSHSNIYWQVTKLIQERRQDGEIDLYLAIIDRMNTLSHARHQRFIVGFIKADNAWFSGRYSNRKIMDHLTEMGIDVIDLTLAPSVDKLSRDYYIHPLDAHPSARANEARAKLLKQYLEKGAVL